MEKVVKEEVPESKFSESFFRGIVDKNHVDSDGIVSASLFFIQGDNPDRKDSFFEESINWNDDNDSLRILFEQRKIKDGTIQFKAGAAVLPLSHIEYVKKMIKVGDHLSYERHAIPNNKYHGNLLLEKSIQKRQMQLIAAAIALGVEEVIPNPN